MPPWCEDPSVGAFWWPVCAETGFFDYEELKLSEDLAVDISFARD